MPHIKVIDKPNADGTPFVTLLKTHPVDSKLAVLPEGFAAYKTGPLAPPLAAVKVIRDIGNHARIEFAPHLTIGGRKHQHLYIFAPHWEGVTAMINLQVTQASSLSPFGSSLVQRQNTHYAQVNNKDWADDGTASNLRYGGVQCGLTSLAIVMSETGFLTAAQYAEVMRLSPTGKFDDGVAAVFKKIGAQSIAMEGHAAVLAYFGIESVCTRSATVAELKAHIEQYGSVVMGTLYKASGHFVAATGFDIKKNLVRVFDPYGIRDKQSTNQWEVQFADESQVKPDWWGPDVMADLWASTNDGWCVMPKPKGKAIALPSAPIATAPAAGPRRFKPQEFRANSIAAKFIGHFEGLELKQYYCSAGVSTIGIGTTRWHDGGSIPVGATITQEEAVKLFQRDAVEFIAEIQRLVDVPLTARQIAAVLSFCYNCGWQGFEESSVLQSINANAPFDEIRANLRKWSKGDDGVLPGLLRRRNAEAMLWENRDDWDSAGFQ